MSEMSSQGGSCSQEEFSPTGSLRKSEAESRVKVMLTVLSWAGINNGS